MLTSLTTKRPFNQHASAVRPFAITYPRHDSVRREDGMDMYAYVGNDPVNLSDPLGLEEIVVTGRIPTPRPEGAMTAEDYARQGQAGALIARGNLWGMANTFASWCYSSGRCTFRSQPGTKPNLIQAAVPYSGESFCSGATVGAANRFNPFGRINSVREGGFGTALGDVGRIASANGIRPLGEVMVGAFTVGPSILSALPRGIGNGWSVSTNPFSGYTSFSNSGLTFRYNAESGLIRVDIPSGFNLPSGGELAQNETCHYR